MKKLLALLLALVMVVSLVACDTQKQPEETKAPSASKPEETKAPETTAAPEEPVTLTMFFKYSDGSVSYAKEDVKKAIQAHVLENYNIDLQFIDTPMSIMGDIVSTAITAGDNWDLGTVDQGIFSANVGRNAFMAYDDYMDLIPDVVEQVPEGSWGAFTYNGKIYGSAPVKDLAENWNWISNKTLEDAIGVEFPADKFYTTMDLIPYLYEVKEARDEKYPDLKDFPVYNYFVYFPAMITHDCVVGGWNNTVLATNAELEHGFKSIPDTSTVFCPYMTEDFRNIVKTIWQAAKDGVIFANSGFDPDKYLANNGYLIGREDCGWIEYDGQSTMPYYESELHMANISVAYTGYIQAVINVVNAECKNPEKAFELINAVYVDEDLCNLFKFGIEGEHWTDTDNNGVVELTEANSDPANRAFYSWYPIHNMVSCTCGKVDPSSTPNFANALDALNASGVASPNLGFVADTAPVANELAAVQSVLSQYGSQWKLCGAIETEEELNTMLDNFAKDLKANGVETLIAEIQSQLDAWRNAQ